MATIEVANVDNQQHARTLLWEALVAGSLDGAGVELPDHADKSVQVVGTFDGATLTFQGSNDGTNWASLTDPTGSAIALAAAGLKQIMENTRYVRPLLAGGSGSEDIDVYLHVRSQR